MFELDEGGGGRAKGFGGPEAPALRRAEADGEGGGRTTEEEWERARLDGVLIEAVAAPTPAPATPLEF